MHVFNTEPLDKWLSVAEKTAILLAAGVAAIKFKVFGQWEEDHLTDMEFNYDQHKGLVWAYYTIANIGDRPFVVSCVRLDLYPAKSEIGEHLVPDKDKPLVASTFIANDPKLAKLLGGFDKAKKHHLKEPGTLDYLQKGQRTRFTLRCQTKEPLPEIFFVVAEWWRKPKAIGERWQKPDIQGEDWRNAKRSKKYKHSFFNHFHVQTVGENKSLAHSASGVR